MPASGRCVSREVQVTKHGSGGRTWQRFAVPVAGPNTLRPQQINPRFFDPKLPGDSVQPITIRMGVNKDPDAQYVFPFQHIWDTLEQMKEHPNGAFVIVEVGCLEAYIESNRFRI